MKRKTKQTTRTGTESEKWKVIQPGGGRGRMEEKVQGIRSINSRYKIDRVVIKNSIGNIEAKNLYV